MPSTTSSPGSDPIDVDPRDSLRQHLGYSFTDDALLDLALSHRSWCSENGGLPSNERLEFLGDAILGLVVTDHLFHSAPTLSEGVLAQWRSELVSAPALADMARRVGLGAAMYLGKGEESSGGRDKSSILADAMEAVLGAIYVDGGHGAAAKVILSLLSDRISDVEAGEVTSDFKSRLQELAARRFGELPRYALTEDGPEHQKEFRAVVRVNGVERGDGWGRTKKEAEQGAARQAFDGLNDHVDPDADPGDTTVSETSADRTPGSHDA